MNYEKTPEQEDRDAARKEDFEYADRAKHALDRGYEVPDPTPVAPPIGYVPTPPIEELIKTMIQRHMSLAAQAEGFETFDEANDFDVEDEDGPTPYSEYELRELGSDPEPLTEADIRSRMAELQTELDKLPKKPEPPPPTGDKPAQEGKGEGP